MNSKAFPKIHIIAILSIVSILLIAFFVSPEKQESIVITLNTHEQPYQSNTQITFYSNVQVKDNVFEEPGSILNDPILEKTIIEPIIDQNKPAKIVAVEISKKQLKPTKSILVKKQDTLSHIFERSGAGVRLMMNLLSNKAIKKTLTPIKPGESIEFHYDENDQIDQVHLVRDAKFQVVISGIVNKKYNIKEKVSPSIIKTHFKSAAIKLSLFGSAEKAGINANLTAQVMHIFGWDIDFGQDLRSGDRLSVLYEQEYINDIAYGKGNVIAAQFLNKGELFQATSYKDASGRTDYYNENGNSMKKSFLRTPVDASRISSSFSKKRFHPVHQTYKRHTGTDYAAPSGTSIKASGDGKVIFAGVKGGYGNVIIIRHQQGITTLYAHMKYFKKGTKVGSRVNQGDTIGYVGKSGTATGYHLHYEFRVDGVHKNPETVKLPKAEPINKKYLTKYLAHAKFLLSNLSTQRIALQQIEKSTEEG
ncbi:MAG: peptidoglycan DD-metalloendopeptidase family protein [Pseudomonadales bacterium]|nr:peptidoglycan DD-metalloendopeptidase family protein [Pseudomonadales bacterium]